MNVVTGLISTILSNAFKSNFRLSFASDDRKSIDSSPLFDGRLSSLAFVLGPIILAIRVLKAIESLVVGLAANFTFTTVPFGLVISTTLALFYLI